MIRSKPELEVEGVGGANIYTIPLESVYRTQVSELRKDMYIHQSIP